VLTRRNVELLWRDSSTVRLLALQAPIVALFVLLGFFRMNYDQRIMAPRLIQPEEKSALLLFNTALQTAYQSQEDAIKKVDPQAKVKHIASMLQDAAHAETPIVPDRFIVNPFPTYTLLFLICIIILWFGCNNSAKEIVKEDAIYRRERAVNLGILPYLSSKFLVLSAITALQTLLLMVLIYGSMEFGHAFLHLSRPNPDYRLAYLMQFGVLALLGMTGVALGLCLSALVDNPDQANTLLPYVLIPQVILGGGVLSVKSGLLLWIAMIFSPAYWGFRATRTGETDLPVDFPGRMNYDDSLWFPCSILIAQTIILLVVTAWLLRRKDLRRE
jgi:hypothetical protein